MEMIIKAGKRLATGKDIVGLSLPVRVFEPTSTLNRVVDWMAYNPIYFKRAFNIVIFYFFINNFQKNNPVERMKNVITSILAGQYVQTR